MRAFPGKQRGFWFLLPMIASALGASAGAVAALSAAAAAGTAVQASHEAKKAKSRADNLASLAPTVEPVTAMPMVDDVATKAAKKRSLLDQRRRRGRASTILTDGDSSGAGLGG
jgi:hypothetical protein